MKVSELFEDQELDEGVVTDMFYKAVTVLNTFLDKRKEKKQIRAAILNPANQEQIESMIGDMEKFSKSLLAPQRKLVLTYIKDARHALKFIQGYNAKSSMSDKAIFEREIQVLHSALNSLDRLGKEYAKNKKVQLKRGPKA